MLQPQRRDGTLGRAHDRQIEAARHKARQKTHGFVVDELHLDAGMLGAEILQQHRHQAGGGGVDGADAQFSRRQPSLRAGSLDEGLRLGEEEARVLQKRRALRRERDGARRALEQRDAQLFLKQADVAPERGGRHAKRLRGVTEMQVIGRRDKAAKAVEVHGGRA